MPLNTFDSFSTGGGRHHFASLKKLETALGVSVTRLPVSIRLVLESVLRNCDGGKVARARRALATGSPTPSAPRKSPSWWRAIVLQDFTGVPLLVDLAAMRSRWQRLGRDPKMIEPLVPVDLVVDHSVQVDFFGTPDALRPQPGDGVRAQPRALPVPEVGHAGLRDVQGRAAGHRHRAPGEPGVPGQGWPAWKRTAWSTIPTPWWARIRTPP